MPEPGQVYRSPNGLPMIYVRTEKAPGRQESEHLFVCTRERTVFSLWAKETPPEFELVIDGEGRRQANDAEWRRHVAEHERDLLTELLAQACRWLPRERADELRQRWRERQP